MPHRSRIALTALLVGQLFAPQLVRSQADSAPALSEITVVAPKPPEPSQIAGRNVQTFVRSHGNPGKRTGQLGRWQAAICAQTRGLTPGFNDFVSARVQAIAAAIRLPQQSSQSCTPNVLIIFTTEPQKLMDNVTNQRPELLGFHYMSEIAKLKTVNRPVQAWYVTGTHGRLDFVIDDIWGQMPSGEIGSRLHNGLTSVVVFALVVIDTNKVTGYPIGAISDYIAMVTLSQTRLMDDCGELPSILDLMAGACKSEKPDSITAGDIAYLRALYTIRLDRDLLQQRAAIETTMLVQFASHQRAAGASAK
jgi:hypothetical protein